MSKWRRITGTRYITYIGEMKKIIFKHDGKASLGRLRHR
jgi:hypothetical protein